VYRWSLTMAMSILHRATGIALSVGSVLLVFWLAALAAGPDAFATAQAVVGSPIGLLLLFGWSVALFYHLCNGIRQLFWDIGMGCEKSQARRSGGLTLVGTGLLTILAWGLGLSGGRLTWTCVHRSPAPIISDRRAKGPTPGGGNASPPWRWCR
jgi:succinate dehydrogenase / fumarate reductase cytochrome b subunit